MQEQVNSPIQKAQKAESGERFTLDPAINRNVKNTVPPHSASLRSANEYAELKQLIKQRGLLDKQPVYYTYKIIFTLSLLVIGLAFLVLVNNFWLQLLDAVYLSFAFTQISFLGHDIGHRQVFRTPWKIDVSGMLIGNLLVGWSSLWWVDKHNRHHGHPNQLDMDPDIAMPLMAFTEEEARSRRGFQRFVVKYQAYFVFPLQMLAPLIFLIFSIDFLRLKKSKYSVAEIVFIAIHFLLFFGLLLSRMNIWQVVLFTFVHQALFGLYLGSVAAPNHKGMLVVDKDSQLDFLRQQVLTSRNVKAHPLTDFWYGGLNYQIEHHLFPTMPRNRLREAQHIVRDFCKTHAINYHETSMLQSYKEIVQHMHQVSAPLRAKA